MTQDVTPIRQQYLDIKKKHPNDIVFFRLGDFYETFDQDAETTSRELNIVLTSRNVAKGQRIPMAGIPYHAAENYLSRLINKGYHVAICEQIGEQPVKGIFPRAVVRVVTPGTVIEPGLLKGDQNNYLLAIVRTENSAGIAYADITTGKYSATELTGNEMIANVRAEVARLQPSEILTLTRLDFGVDLSGQITECPSWYFDRNRANESLCHHFGVSTLDGFGFRAQNQAIRAAGALLQYIRETQPDALQILTNIQYYKVSEFMALDLATRRNLELTQAIRSEQVDGSLFGILDQTVTTMGKRKIFDWISNPLLDLIVIEQRQAAISSFLDHGMLRAQIRKLLKQVGDLERSVNRAVTRYASPRDLVAIRSSLAVIPDLLQKLQENALSDLDHVTGDIDPCSDIHSLLVASIVEDPPATISHIGIFQPGFSAELDSIVAASSHAQEWIASLEPTERERTGIKSLKVGYNKIFGYYIEITHSNTAAVPPEYIRKQTLVNAERYITPELKEYEALVMNAEQQIREMETKLFREICANIAARRQALLTTAATLAELDTICSLAEVAAINNYCRPLLDTSRILDIQDGRHPVVEAFLKDDRFVPNDIVFENDEIVRIITGPNMSGKSTFLRQVALIVLMAQIGSYVPASSARIGLVDRIFTRIGAQDEIRSGQSTFMVEMIETSNILHNASSKSLLILDEIGRGTSTYDGLSIAWSVVEYIHNHPALRSRTLFATHYHELTQLSELLPGVRNYNVAVTESEGKVIFLHKIVPGGTDRSYGIHVAQLAGIPSSVIQRANEILRQLEASSGKAVNIQPGLPEQMTLFPETNPLLEELNRLDINTLSPIEALNKIYEWLSRYKRSVD